MHSFTENLQLHLTSRPLRMVYLIENINDLKNAITLYTHTWGGAAGAILPIPKNEFQLKEFKISLSKIDPDYIFTSDQKRPSYIDNLLESLPVINRFISSDKISDYIQGKDSIRLPIRIISTNHLASLPYILPVLDFLYPYPINNADIKSCYIVDSQTNYDLSINLQQGILSSVYKDFLLKILNFFDYYKLYFSFSLKPLQTLRA